ncbi:GIY-YIG nuclease family protein [Candidatus Peregrinibacteria bacterium]|nr:GIY-YIG nuclease family protein [Candidatus Peregrinibacteria bacterium]
MRDYCVYMLRCNDGSYYVGITNNVELRIGQHQEGIDPKCYTFRRRPLECVYSAQFQDVRDAISWEKHIKKWSRKKKEALITGNQTSLEHFSRRSYLYRDRPPPT